MFWRRKSLKWRTYEEVAQFLLNQFASELGLGRVEGKQIVAGHAGTDWEIDAKAYRARNEAFLIVECRRYPRSRVSQEEIAGLAYRIKDTGAEGAIVVSPLGLQKGARLVARKECVSEVRLTPDSTTTDYVLQFLNRAFVGMSVKVKSNASIGIVAIRRDGTKEVPGHINES